jgi:hypothetical protein
MKARQTQQVLQLKKPVQQKKKIGKIKTTTAHNKKKQGQHPRRDPQ